MTPCHGAHKVPQHVSIPGDVLQGGSKFEKRMVKVDSILTNVRPLTLFERGGFNAWFYTSLLCKLNTFQRELQNPTELSLRGL